MDVFVNAILQGNFDKIKTSMNTLDVTISINNKLTNGTTPIYLACNVGNLQIVEYLQQQKHTSKVHLQQH